jgi:hypothetical protein
MENKMDTKFKSLHILLVATLFLTACGSDDKDTDGDTVIDKRDNCIHATNSDQLNSDDDSLGNACDDDDDNDGVNDELDAFPLDATEQADVDNDGLGDNIDLDLERSQHNSATIERLIEKGRVITIISPQDVSVGGRIGESIVNAGDVNADGFDDLLIGYGGYELGGISEVGICYLIFGREAGLPSEIFLGQLDQSDLDYVVFQANENETDSRGIGISVSALGDINGDNIDDFTIGAPYVDTDLGEWSGGVAYIVFGRGTWPDKNITISELASIYAMGFKGQQEFGLLGQSIINAGDLNNDTVPDLMISEYRYDLADAEDAGRVHIIFGGDHFTPPVNSQISMTSVDDLPSSIHTVLNGLGTYSKAGYKSVTIGDFNQDQIADVAIQSQDYAASEQFENDGAGAVSMVFGRTTWPAEINLSDLTGSDGFNIYGDGLGLQFGKSLAAADFNNDQVPDVIIGAPDHAIRDDINPNKVYMLWGGSGPWPASITSSQIETTYGNIITTDTDIGLGTSLSVLDDTSGDGRPELLLTSDKRENNIDSRHESDRLYKLTSESSWSNMVLTYDELPDNVDRIGSTTYLDAQNTKALGDYNQDGIQDILLDHKSVYKDTFLDTAYIVLGYKELVQESAAE